MTLEKKQIFLFNINDLYSIEIEEIKKDSIILVCYRVDKKSYEKELLSIITTDTIQKNKLDNDWGLEYDIYKVAEYCKTLI